LPAAQPSFAGCRVLKRHQVERRFVLPPRRIVCDDGGQLQLFKCPGQEISDDLRRQVLHHVGDRGRPVVGKLRNQQHRPGGGPLNDSHPALSFRRPIPDSEEGIFLVVDQVVFAWVHERAPLAAGGDRANQVACAAAQ
jgi:hypothetical protein